MGAQLAKAAGQPHWAATLGLPARVLLHHMALLARDYATGDVAARRYFAGYDSLVLALTGHAREDLDDTEWRRAADRVKRAIRELVAAGAITRVRSAEGGNRAEYEIHPDRFEAA